MTATFTGVSPLFADPFRDLIYQEAQRIAANLEVGDRGRFLVEAGRCCAGLVGPDDVFHTRGGALGAAWDEWAAYVWEREAVWLASS